MSQRFRATLSLGVVLIIIVAAILLYVAGFIDWTLIIPVILALSGCWMLVIAIMRRQDSQKKYAPSAFSSLGIGLVLITISGAWYIYRYNPLYSIALILLVLGAIAIAAALLRK
jgi:hypothetical protein